MNYSDLHGFAPEQLKAIRNDLFNLSKSLSRQDQLLLDNLADYSMLPPSRLLDAYRSATQAAKRHPTAAIVEFGVYRGGALAAMAYGASLSGCFSGPVIGFDTFEGHTSAPMPHEVDLHGNLQRSIFENKQVKGESWADCDFESVMKNYNKIAIGIKASLPSPQLIKGDACLTATKVVDLCPNGISLLRLDMDWYNPTLAALSAAFPLLRSNAIIIVDDYGHHSGVKEVIDAFLLDLEIPFDSSMTDYSCRRIVFLR
jgi:O-methyltransferase